MTQVQSNMNSCYSISSTENFQHQSSDEFHLLSLKLGQTIINQLALFEVGSLD